MDAISRSESAKIPFSRSFIECWLGFTILLHRNLDVASSAKETLEPTAQCPFIRMLFRLLLPAKHRSVAAPPSISMFFHFAGIARISLSLNLRLSAGIDNNKHKFVIIVISEIVTEPT